LTGACERTKEKHADTQARADAPGREGARDDEHFATAGVTRKIKVFNFASVVNSVVDVHFPTREMQCRSKIRHDGQGCVGRRP
jgi:hypothetical protein